MQRINLLPQAERVKASRERGLIWAILILVAVVLALGLVYVKFNNEAKSKQQQVDQITADTALQQQRMAELAPYAAIQGTRTAMTQTARSIYDAGVPFSIILQELSLVIPENVRLQSLTAVVPGSMLPGAAAAAAGGGAAPTSGTADITFVGMTEKHRDVAEFMTRLGLIPQLMNIQLGSSTTSSTSTGTGTGASTVTYMAFTVTAQLRPYAQTPPTTVPKAGTTQP